MEIRMLNTNDLATEVSGNAVDTGPFSGCLN
jgi:hypothetical protein